MIEKIFKSFVEVVNIELTIILIIEYRKNIFDFSTKQGVCSTCNDIDNANLKTDMDRKRISKEFM